MTSGQGNAKVFPQKLQWSQNHEYLAQRIFPRLRYYLAIVNPKRGRPGRDKNMQHIASISIREHVNAVTIHFV